MPTSRRAALRSLLGLAVTPALATKALAAAPLAGGLTHIGWDMARPDVLDAAVFSIIRPDGVHILRRGMRVSFPLSEGTRALAARPALLPWAPWDDAPSHNPPAAPTMPTLPERPREPKAVLAPVAVPPHHAG